MQTGLDFSFAPITGGQVKNAGYSFVMRYLASSTGKRITAAQVADYKANGLGIGLVFEDYANPAQNNPNQPARVCGHIDAGIALSQANALGFPADRPIYFAVDYDAPENAQAWINEYLRGVADVIGAGRVGVYGGFYVVKRCMEAGTAKWGWQTVAWSGGQIYGGAHLYQNGASALNGGADVNEAKKEDFGQWGYNGEGEDIMDKNDNIEFYRFGLHREGSEDETNLRIGAKFSDAANPARSSAEWQDQDRKIKSYDTVANQLTQATSDVAALHQQITEMGTRPTKAQFDELTKAAAAANAKAVAAQAELDKLNKDNATADTQTTGILRALWRKIMGN